MTRALGYAWLALLGGALLVSAAGAYVRSAQVEQYAWACDPFGYLRMAQEVRSAASQGRYPDYRLDAPQTRVLIDFLRSQDVPSADWDELVAPHAHHYFAATGHVGVQYPPGTGLLLALFPQDQCVHRLNEAMIAIFLAVALGVLIVAGRKRAWLAAGGATLALQLGLEMLGWIGDYSYSINALLAPLLLALAALLLAVVLRATGRPAWLTWGVALLGGACFGFAILVRLPVVLLLPGAALLLLGPTWRTWIGGAVIAFSAGVGLCGILPLLIHQQQLAGAWYLPTYSRTDASAPTFAALPGNLSYYLGAGAGSQFQEALLASAVGFAGLALATGPAAGIAAPVRWPRLALSALATWVLPACYFLTHRVAIPYYQFPATFAAAVVLGLGGLALTGGDCRPGGSGRWRRRVGLAAALVPGLLALGLAWRDCPATFSAAVSAHAAHFPAELTDDRAWVFADRLTGTLWYEEQRPAYKVLFAAPKTRALVFRFIFERGEPQYVIRDCPEIQEVLDEIERLGGALEPRGDVDGHPYYLVHWPATGPERLGAK